MLYIAQHVISCDSEREGDNLYQYDTAELDFNTLIHQYRQDVLLFAEVNWITPLARNISVEPGSNPILSFVDILTPGGISPDTLIKKFRLLRDTGAFATIPIHGRAAGFTDIPINALQKWGPRQSCLVDAASPDIYFCIRCTPGHLWFEEGERLLQALQNWLS